MLGLLEIGIKEDIINEMIEYNGITKVTNLNEKFDNVQKIIITFKELMFTEDTINSLLIYLIDLFFIDYDKILLKIKEYDPSELSEIINNNYEEAYKLFMRE